MRDGVGQIKMEKSCFTVTVTLPILPVLSETLAAGPCGDLTFIAGEPAQPLTKESFGNLFRDACRSARVPGSAHGVRCDTSSERGRDCRTARSDLWVDRRHDSVALHTRRDRERLAREAMHMLANEKRTSIPSPKHKVGAREQKQQ